MSKLPLPAPDVSHSVQDVALAELYPLMREILDGGGSFTLTVTGTSMYPFILGGRAVCFSDGAFTFGDEETRLIILSLCRMT